MEAADPIAALMADLGPAPQAVRELAAGKTPAVAITASPEDGLFLIYDERPFSTASATCSPN